MKKVLSSRMLIMLVTLGILLALILLAVSLENLHFQPGRIIYQNESQEIQFSIDKIVEGIIEIPFWKQAIFWISAFFVIILVAFLFPPELRKRIINYFLRLVVFLLLVYFIYKNYQVLFPDLNFNLNTQVTIDGSQIPESTIPEFSQPQFSSSILYFISFLIIIGIILVSFFLITRWIKKNKSRKNSSVLGDIAEIARSSIWEISSGESLEDAIIQCYARMSETVSVKKGVDKPQYFTPREFVQKLVSVGLPSNAVERLTGLFESVRYGARLSTEKDRKEAYACLNSIIKECDTSL